MVCSLAMLAAAGAPLPGTPRWLVGTSRAAPAVMLIGGICAACPLASRSRVASATMAVGSTAVATWTAWLSTYLFGEVALPLGTSIGTLAYVGAGLGALSLAMILRAGASVFRLLLLASFTYLSFQAIRNINLFGLVAGAVLAWNVSEWIARLATDWPHRRATGVVAPALVAGLAALWAVGVFTDRYHVLLADNVHFGLRERPLMFGNAAARFAGSTGLPERALRL